MPFCPIHGAEMLPSTKGSGGFFCSKKNPDGSYCKHRVAGGYTAPAPQPQEPVATHPAHTRAVQQGLTPRPTADVATFAQRDRLSAAQTCLKCVFDLYQGQPEKVGSAMALAHRLYAWLMERREGAPIPDFAFDPDWWNEANRS